MLTIENIFKFGKYKGQQVEDVLTDDPEYIKWLCENTDIMFDEETLEKLEKELARKKY